MGLGIVGSMTSRVLYWISALFLPTNLGAQDHDWPVYHGDHAGSHYSPLDQINAENVHELHPAWIFRTESKGNLQCNPLALNGVVYLVDQKVRVFALDGATGEQRWHYDPKSGGLSRGFAHWQSVDGSQQRLFYSAGNFVHALDLTDGSLVQTFADQGKLDLRNDLDIGAARLSVSAKTPGIVFEDLLIMGSNVGEGPSVSAPGHIRAYDVHTGERRWIFHTIPHPGEPGYETWPADAWKKIGGANCWGGLSLDVDRGLVIFGTGSPSYDHYGGNRVGKNLYGNCVMALNASTGAYIWHLQTVHHDLWDYDLPCQPNLVTVTHNGKQIDAVAQSTKLGHCFLLDRDTGKPLFPIEERPVPVSKIPGEVSWPTQPFPTKPPAYAQQRFTLDEVTDLNPAATTTISDRLHEMITGDVFIPPGEKPSVVLPQFNGGGEWGGAAHDPVTGWLYVNVSNEAEWISMVKAKPQGKLTKGQLGLQLFRAICANCHGNKALRPEGTTALPPLKTIAKRLSKTDTLTLLKEGRNLMPSFTDLAEIERESLVAYLFNEGSNDEVNPNALTGAWADDLPYVATGHNDFRDPQGYPVNKRPWGTLNAIDLNLGIIAWQVPLGTYPALEKLGESTTGTFNIGGPLLTGGGLLFIGATMDERFRAFDKTTGKVVWEYQMEAGGYASPATYQVNGKQHIIIAAGGSGKAGTKAGNAYYSFALAN